VASLEPTFGGINLEDIKAQECFYIDRALRERMKIPVFHDDQHGTAIIVPVSTNSSAWGCGWRHPGRRCASGRAPEDAKAVGPGVIIATGRSDYPNQVKKVLRFPFPFRAGARRAKTIEEMKSAAARTVTELEQCRAFRCCCDRLRGSSSRVRAEIPDTDAFDPRLIERVAPAVAKAAMEGIATRLRIDFEAYRQRRGLMPPWVVFSLISLLRRHPLDIIRISVRTPQGLLEKGLAQSLKRSCGDDHIWL